MARDHKHPKHHHHLQPHPHVQHYHAQGGMPGEGEIGQGDEFIPPRMGRGGFQPPLTSSNMGRAQQQVDEHLGHRNNGMEPVTYSPTWGAPKTPDSHTAVYDISAGKVYMPDGRVLEAHSGRGGMKDNANYVGVPMHGPIPPGMYDMSVRKGLFCGEQALRLTPENPSQTHGRGGFLAHGYLLGPNGDSEGCPSFRDYDTFLDAYKHHGITRMQVVSGYGNGGELVSPSHVGGEGAARHHRHKA